MRGYLERVVPAYGWLRRYNRGDLANDFSAALIITAMLVPQGMAYALLAGLPARYGLYASTVPAIVYALFGTSRHMPVGPPALMALLTFTSISALAEPGTSEYISYALLLALMVGALQLAIGLLHMGFVTNFISHPVLSGFIFASAVIIALSQLEHLLGIPVEGAHSAVGTVHGLVRGIEEHNPLTLTLGLASIAAILVLGRLAPRLPAPLLTVAAATLVVALLRLDGRGVDVVGNVPQGLPALSVPALEFEVVRQLAPAAVVVAFVGFVESISVAKAVAARDNYKIDSNKELRALGLANTAAAFFSGFPVAGSFSRTAVQHQAGGRTQAASIMTALMIVGVLLFLTPLFYYLPNAALAAVILVAVYALLDFSEARRIFRLGLADGLAMVVTFLVTVLVGVEEGIIAGVIFAMVVFVRRTAYPEIAELGYVESEDAFLGTNSYPQAITFPQTLIVRFDARLYFANVPQFEDWLISATADRQDLKLLVIDCRGVNGIDVTAIEGLENLISEYRSRGVEVLLTHTKLQVRRRLENAGWSSKYPRVIDHQTTRDALGYAGLLGRMDPKMSLPRGYRVLEPRRMHFCEHIPPCCPKPPAAPDGACVSRCKRLVSNLLVATKTGGGILGQGDEDRGLFREHRWPVTSRDALLVMLSVAGGSVDAMVFLGVSEVFPANMTGNTVLLGLAFSQGHWQDLLAGSVALLGFVLGIAAGVAIVERRMDDALWPPSVTAAVALECGALIAFALEWSFVADPDGAAAYSLVAVVAAAMGLQGAAVRRLGVPGITATFVTGTLASLVSRVVRRIRMVLVPGAETTGRSSTRELIQPAAVLLAYAAGAVLGSLLALRWGSIASVLPTALVAVVAVTATVLYRRP